MARHALEEAVCAGVVRCGEARHHDRSSGPGHGSRPETLWTRWRTRNYSQDLPQPLRRWVVMIPARGCHFPPEIIAGDVTPTSLPVAWWRSASCPWKETCKTFCVISTPKAFATNYLKLMWLLKPFVEGIEVQLIWVSPLEPTYTPNQGHVQWTGPLSKCPLPILSDLKFSILFGKRVPKSWRTLRDSNSGTMECKVVTLANTPRSSTNH